MRCGRSVRLRVWTLLFGAFFPSPSPALELLTRIGPRTIAVDAVPAGGPAVAPLPAVATPLVAAPIARAEAPKPSSAGRSLAEASSLQSVFNGVEMRVVFDGDAGDAAWQRDVGGQPWLSENATVIGFDLLSPKVYAGGYPAVTPKDGVGRTVLADAEHPLFPRPATVDLVHVGFMDMDSLAEKLDLAPDWPRRLRQYAGLVKEGGYLMMAHSQDYAGCFSGNKDIRQTLEEAILKIGGWARVAVFDQARLPGDYPVTTWWRRSSGSGNNFLLVFQKKPAP